MSSKNSYVSTLSPLFSSILLSRSPPSQFSLWSYMLVIYMEKVKEWIILKRGGVGEVEEFKGGGYLHGVRGRVEVKRFKGLKREGQRN